MAMRISVRHRFGRFSKGIVFFLMTFWCIICSIFAIGFFIKDISSGNGGMMAIPAILGTLFLIFAIIFLSFGLYRVKGCVKKNKIIKQGIKAIGAIGGLSSRIVYYQGLVITKKLVFYYKLPDGRIGETTQLISGSLYSSLKNRGSREIPICILGDAAVIDERKIY